MIDLKHLGLINVPSYKQTITSTLKQAKLPNKPVSFTKNITNDLRSGLLEFRSEKSEKIARETEQTASQAASKFLDNTISVLYTEKGNSPKEWINLTRSLEEFSFNQLKIRLGDDFDRSKLTLCAYVAAQQAIDVVATIFGTSVLHEYGGHRDAIKILGGIGNVGLMKGSVDDSNALNIGQYYNEQVQALVNGEIPLQGVCNYSTKKRHKPSAQDIAFVNGAGFNVQSAFARSLWTEVIYNNQHKLLDNIDYILNKAYPIVYSLSRTWLRDRPIVYDDYSNWLNSQKEQGADISIKDVQLCQALSLLLSGGTWNVLNSYKQFIKNSDLETKPVGLWSPKIGNNEITIYPPEFNTWLLSNGLSVSTDVCFKTGDSLSVNLGIEQTIRGKKREEISLGVVHNFKDNQSFRIDASFNPNSGGLYTELNYTKTFLQAWNCSLSLQAKYSDGDTMRQEHSVQNKGFSTSINLSIPIFDIK